jgi:uncharacterized protein YbgA (DUF1722 family)/uncharacterized protein YbbK (DUF523 family)
MSGSSSGKKRDTPPADNDRPAIRVGISSCLLGEEVRYDGGHKHDSLITGLLGRWFEFVPVCPEVEIGLGIPRPNLRLVGSVDAPRMITQKTGEDHTDTMQRYATRRASQLARLDLHGYILKRASPSCGMERVKVYEGKGPALNKGVGLFAAALMERLPSLPVEEEGRLRDAPLRENFIERVFARYRWFELLRQRPTAGKLVHFHTRHKLALLAHNEVRYRKMGRLVARAGTMPLRELLPLYESELFGALKVKATRRTHANVLYHLMGFLKKHLSAENKRELIDCTESYRQGLVPLIVPITLMKHHFRDHPATWVASQTYLNPYPAELMLRNAV